MRKFYLVLPVLFLFMGLSHLNAQTPPYAGTIFIDGNIITASDPSVIQSTTYAGRGERKVWDSREAAWVDIIAFLFNVVWNDGLTSEAIINPEFGSEAAAAVEAEKYAYLIGKLPYSLRVDVDEIWVHKGIASFGGGNRSIVIHTGRAAEYEADNILEETLVHEAAHTSLDIAHSSSAGWLAAQQNDGNFISTYAQDNPTREDIAESFLTWMAVRYRANRISQTDYDKITQAIPNRLLYFDAQNFNLSPVLNTLPVKLVSFSVTLQNKNASLTWTTAQEQKAKSFFIERSEDGLAWRIVGSVVARGNSDSKQDYSYTDYSISSNYFYRLKMTDREGSINYSAVQQIRINNPGTISFYPDPVINSIIFRNTGSLPIVKVVLTNIQGGQIMEVTGNRNEIEVKNLTPGIYFLQIFTKEEIFKYRFVKK